MGVREKKTVRFVYDGIRMGQEGERPFDRRTGTAVFMFWWYGT